MANEFNGVADKNSSTKRNISPLDIFREVVVHASEKDKKFRESICANNAWTKELVNRKLRKSRIDEILKDN